MTTVAFFGILLVTSIGGNLNLITYAESDSAENNEWQLTVTGLVQQSLSISLADLFAMSQTSIQASLVCAGPPSLLVTEGNWTGVMLWLILQEAGLLNETVKIAFYAKDGYTTDLTPEIVQHDDVLVAYKKDGVPLTETLRLVVPGRWGYKWISQLTAIELVDYDFLGVYESRGYPDNGIGTPYIEPYLGPYTAAPGTPPSQSTTPNPSITSTSVPSANSGPPDASSQSPFETSNQTEKPKETAGEGFVPSPRFLYTLTAIIITIIIVVFLHYALARISLKTLFFGGKRVRFF